MTTVAHLCARQDSCPACGKRCYRSRSGARQAARLLHASRRMYAYPCWPYWHLTSATVPKPLRSGRKPQAAYAA